MGNKQQRKRTVETHRIIRRIAILMVVLSVCAAGYGLSLIVKTGTELFEGATGELKAECIAEMAEGFVLLIHYLLVVKFLMHMLKHGGLFRYEVGKEVRIIGWETILLPIAASIVGCIAYSGLKLPFEVFKVNVYELAMGLVLVCAGFVVEYGEERIELAKEIIREDLKEIEEDEIKIEELENKVK